MVAEAFASVKHFILLLHFIHVDLDVMGLNPGTSSVLCNWLDMNRFAVIFMSLNFF
jgi:hypothetical protein